MGDNERPAHDLYDEEFLRTLRWSHHLLLLFGVTLTIFACSPGRAAPYERASEEVRLLQDALPVLKEYPRNAMRRARAELPTTVDDRWAASIVRELKTVGIEECPVVVVMGANQLLEPVYILNPLPPEPTVGQVFGWMRRSGDLVRVEPDGEGITKLATEVAQKLKGWQLGDEPLQVKLSNNLSWSGAAISSFTFESGSELQAYLAQAFLEGLRLTDDPTEEYGRVPVSFELTFTGQGVDWAPQGIDTILSGAPVEIPLSGSRVDEVRVAHVLGESDKFRGLVLDEEGDLSILEDTYRVLADVDDKSLDAGFSILQSRAQEFEGKLVFAGLSIPEGVLLLAGPTVLLLLLLQFCIHLERLIQRLPRPDTDTDQGADRVNLPGLLRYPWSILYPREGPWQWVPSATLVLPTITAALTLLKRVWPHQGAEDYRWPLGAILFFLAIGFSFRAACGARCLGNHIHQAPEKEQPKEQPKPELQ